MLTHKYYVAKYCFQIGLYWQGITHDLSKFSFTEFSGAIKYWDDNISSLANECKILGYSQTFLHHRGRNPHHYDQQTKDAELQGYLETVFVNGELVREYSLSEIRERVNSTLV
ncbi:DUF5662 family protein [Catenibacterium sp.]|uniref:DUF5662 family protein n=1 Tax=Catenibacterium sp. TaxID=2049022 RepID=UPI003FA4CFD7